YLRVNAGFDAQCRVGMAEAMRSDIAHAGIFADFAVTSIPSRLGGDVAIKAREDEIRFLPELCPELHFCLPRSPSLQRSNCGRRNLDRAVLARLRCLTDDRHLLGVPRGGPADMDMPGIEVEILPAHGPEFARSHPGGEGKV